MKGEEVMQALWRRMQKIHLTSTSQRPGPGTVVKVFDLDVLLIIVMLQRRTPDVCCHGKDFGLRSAKRRRPPNQKIEQKRPCMHGL
ncbi:MAG: hypothetical protein RR687_06940 [Comamonas sp.]|uniref:hypothetical protein n=1 Tax=Comamonas sp. lk TaxID=2201272 RepID=UPI000EB3948B|nr:hypothetical protein [Comamonas sp. lk]